MRNYLFLTFYVILQTSIFSATLPKEMDQWGYQLHSYSEKDLMRIQTSQKTLWVIDYSMDGTGALQFSSQMIDSFKKNQNLIISYFCLGEAEAVRFYWDHISPNIFIFENDIQQGLPYKKEYINFYTLHNGQKVLSRSNEEFVDNFPIKYWSKEWQEMLYKSRESYLNKILDSHFDGVYLDTVDAFEYYQDEHVEKMAVKMAELVIEIGKKGKERNPNFIILLQNGVWMYELLESHPQLRDQLFSYVKAFGIEDLFYPGEGNNNGYDFNKFHEYDYIKKIRESYDVTFFTVDYIPGATIEEKKKYFEKAKKKNLIPVISDRDLGGHLTLLKEILL